MAGNHRTGLVWCCSVALLVGCANGPARTSSDDPETSPPKATAPASRGTADQRIRIIAAYRGMWRTFVDAARTSDYQSPELARYSAGGAHSLLVRGLLNDHRHGIVTIGTPAFNPHVAAMKPPGHPTRASVKDCADSSHWLTYNRAGKVVGDRSPGRRSIEAELRLFGEAWKVTDLVVENEGTC